MRDSGQGATVTDHGIHFAAVSPRPEVLSTAAQGLGREGMVTVWDDRGRYLGCMGVEAWERLLREAARAE